MRSHYRARQVAFWRELVPRLQRAGRLAERPPLSFDVDSVPEDRLFLGHVRPACSRHFNSTTTAEGVPILATAAPSTAPVTSLSTPPSAVTTQSLHTISRSHGDNKSANDPSPSSSDNRSSYSSVLGVTVIVGCSLLVLNLLIFAGVFYQRKKLEAVRKGLLGDSPTSLVSLDVVQRSEPRAGGSASRRNSFCADSIAKGVCRTKVDVTQTMLQEDLVNGDIDIQVPLPPPPPRSGPPTLELPRRLSREKRRNTVCDETRH